MTCHAPFSKEDDGKRQETLAGSIVVVALIIFVVFAGVSLVITTVAVAILIGQGRLTLPRTNHRRVQRERAELTLAQIRLERESLHLRLDEAIQLRLERASDATSREPGKEVRLFSGGE